MFVINPFLNIRNYIQDTKGKWRPKKDPVLKQARNINQDVLTGTDIIVFEEWDKKVIVDTLEFSINGDLSNIHAILHSNINSLSSDYTDQLFYTVNPSGTRSFATPVRLSNDGSSYFEVVSYDSSINQAKFSLKKPIVLPAGGRLAFRPGTGYVSGGKVVYKSEYRVFE